MLLPPLHRRQATLRCLAAMLPPPLRRRQAAANLALSRCRHRLCWLVVALLSAVLFRHRMPFSLPAAFADKLSSIASTGHRRCRRAAGPLVELTVVHWRRKRDDFLVDKAGTKTCYYSSGGALVARGRLPLQRFAMVGCLRSLLSRSSSSTTSS
jgi:hypothetical protein